MAKYIPHVEATQLTADKIAFLLSFNRGRTGYPFAVDNGRRIFIVVADGMSIDVPLGTWVVESRGALELYGDAKFREGFTQA